MTSKSNRNGFNLISSGEHSGNCCTQIDDTTTASLTNVVNKIKKKSETKKEITRSTHIFTTDTTTSTTSTMNYQRNDSENNNDNTKKSTNNNADNDINNGKEESSTEITKTTLQQNVKLTNNSTFPLTTSLSTNSTNIPNNFTSIDNTKNNVDLNIISPSSILVNEGEEEIVNQKTSFNFWNYFCVKRPININVDNNFRAAYLHILADAVVSLFVVISLFIAQKYEKFLFLDPLSGLIGGFVVLNWALVLVQVR